MLELGQNHFDSIVVHARESLPHEACGLLAGTTTPATVERLYPCRNVATVEGRYEINPPDALRAHRDADERGLEVIGAYHSHPISEAFPSATDVALAPDPTWRYCILTLTTDPPQLRAFSIDGNAVVELGVRLRSG